ncbi:MAG: hypothetical protein Q4E67_04585 [Planctomycetia bacterium]|nr:hypothetical protein [Planctomycetia bacterium]
MKYLQWTGNVALLLGWLVSVGEAAPTWSPALSGNALQGNTTVTLDGNYTQSSALTGDYSLTVTGGYTLEFTEAQKFTGGTVIGAGTTVKLNRPDTSGMAEGILPKYPDQRWDAGDRGRRADGLRKNSHDYGQQGAD